MAENCQLGMAWVLFSLQAVLEPQLRIWQVWFPQGKDTNFSWTLRGGGEWGLVAWCSRKNVPICLCINFTSAPALPEDEPFQPFLELCRILLSSCWLFACLNVSPFASQKDQSFYFIFFYELWSLWCTLFFWVYACILLVSLSWGNGGEWRCIHRSIFLHLKVIPFIILLLVL